MTKQIFISILTYAIAFLSCGSVYGQGNNKKTVAVITAEGESVSKDIRIGVTNGLQEGVFNSGEYTLLARGAAFDKALSEMKFQQSGAVSDDQLTEFGHATGAEFVCYATISKYSETSYLISYKMINVATSEIVNVGSEPVRNGADGLLTATENIAKKLFGNKPAPTPNNPPAPASYNSPPTPSNLSTTAYLNSADVFMAMPEYKQMQASLESSQAGFQAELKSMSDEYSKKLSDYISQQNSLDENTKVRRQQELQDLQQRVENFQQSAAQQQDELQQKLLAPIQDKLQRAINDAGNENNFLYITNYQACRYVSPSATDATPFVKRKLGLQTSPDNNPPTTLNNLSSTAYLNYTDAVTAMPEYKQMQTSLESSEAEFQTKLKSMSDEYSKKLSDYISQQNSLDENAKSLRQQEIQDLQQRAENFQQTAAQQQDEMQQKMSAPVQDKLQRAINDVGNENKFLYIFDSQVIVYVSPNATDATPLVKRKLGLQTSPNNNPASAPNNRSSAYINYTDVVTAMPEYKQMQASLESSQAEFQAKLKNMSDEYNKKMSDYMEQRNSLNQSIRDRREQELDGLREQAANFQQEAQQEQDAMQQRLSAPVLDKLQKAINDAGKENNFLYIVNSQAYFYVSPGATDATPLVKRKLGLQ